MAQIAKFPVERRRHPRTQLQMTLRGIQLDPDGDVVDTFHMVDISRSGIGAVVERAYYRGQRVVLNLPILPDGARRNVYATVVRCRPDSEGFRVGMQLDTSWSNPYAIMPAPAVAAA